MEQLSGSRSSRMSEILRKSTDVDNNGDIFEEYEDKVTVDEASVIKKAMGLFGEVNYRRGRE